MKYSLIGNKIHVNNIIVGEVHTKGGLFWASLCDYDVTTFRDYRDKWMSVLDALNQYCELQGIEFVCRNEKHQSIFDNIKQFKKDCDMEDAMARLRQADFDYQRRKEYLKWNEQ